MMWRFSDGTIAHLGGEIEGASLFAQELRSELDEKRVGIQLYPGPGGGAWLDRNDPAQFDAWLEQERIRPFRRAFTLRIIERPTDIPALLPDPRKFGDLPEDALI